jgi:translation initiation factor IF-2
MPLAKAAKSRERSAPKKPVVELSDSVNVRQLAELLRVDPIDIIKQLMRNGIMANINQVINYEVAAVIVVDFGHEPKVKHQALKKAVAATKVKQKLQPEDDGNLSPRPPVVTIMGHVDHGKTKLLDAIRQSNVAAKEAGSITQHIGAYQVDVSGQKVTFLDTPGHEAFTAMRARGAQATDVAVLVVAADDGVMPQTLEALDHARAAGVPIIVAINKVDKANANVDRVKQQLADNNLVIEEWGGDTIAVPVSAKEQKGIPDLLESILLVAEMEDLKANPNQHASGVVVEAEMDKTRGPLATILVNTGTLKLGDVIIVGSTWGKVKAMFNDGGKRLKKAEPATPVEVMGLADVPQVGDILSAVSSESEARALIQKHLGDKKREPQAVRLDKIYDQISAGDVKELNIILKTDVQGSIEPIRSSLERLSGEEVKVRIIRSAVGNVTEGDVMLAIASEALIIGFNTTIDSGAQRLADSKGVDIRRYDVIYNLIDDVEKALKGMLAPKYVEVIEGKAEVRAVFSSGKNTKIAGSYMTDGKVSRNSSVRVIRNGKVLHQSTISSLRRFKDDVKEVATGFECGIGVKDFHDFEIGDILEFFKQEKQ